MPEFLINILTHPAFTAVIGFLAGHFLAIGRDRRKEFNDTAEDIFAKLSDEHRYIGNFKGVTKIEFQIFRRRLLPWQRRSFDRYVEEYYETKKDKFKKENQGVHHQGTPEIRAAIEKLLKFTKRR